MRAARLIQLLLLLQNRGRSTCAVLAAELEVARRTIMRDVDALSEAGLPIVMHRGQRGGIELGFDYRTRLTGLADDEAEALGVLLSRPLGPLHALGIADAATRARRKLIESLPDTVLTRATEAERRFRVADQPPRHIDPRVAALAAAIRDHREVRINADRGHGQVVHPVALIHRRGGWWLEDARTPRTPIALRDCGPINISARRFELMPEMPTVLDPPALAGGAVSGGAPRTPVRGRRSGRQGSRDRC